MNIDCGAPARFSTFFDRRSVLRGLATVPFATVTGRFACAAMPTLAFVGFNTRQESTGPRDAILEGLAERGLVADRNCRWVERYADGMVERVEPLVKALLVDGVDAIVVGGGATRHTIATAAGRVPVIYGYSGDPVAAGFADSLARPRGNTTGVSLMLVEINAKRIQILKDMAPATRRIALLSHPNHPGEAAEVEVCRRAVATLGIELLYLPVHSREDIERALLQAESWPADALVALPDSITVPNRQRIAAWALARRIPSASGWAMFAESGALMTYGPSLRDCYRRVGQLAAMVLAGARPADLPVEQPTRFELIVNARTARAISLPLGDALLARADVVIE